MIKPCLVALALSLSGCASTHMKQYMGKDIREVVLDSGPPVNALDMGDGVRAFQFRWGGGAMVVPTTTRATASATSIGNQTWYQVEAITQPGGVVASEGCIITYLTAWNPEKTSWVVTGYRIPKELVC